MPNAPSILFLAYLLVFLPSAALRSARRLRAAAGDGPPLPSREAIWAGTLLFQGLLLVLSWITARTIGLDLSSLPRLGVRDLLAALAALALYFVLRALSRASRSEAERRKMTVFRLSPRTTREWVLWCATVVVASIAEEAAYRGVGMSILSYALGSALAATLVCATAFALAHFTQGAKSMAVIFAMALVMHALVAVTATLVLAMLVHAAYDFAAGASIARQAQRFDREASPAGG